MARSLIFSFFFLLLIKSYSQTGKLIVLVQDINAAKGGELSTGIFLKENFPKVGKQLLGSETTITANPMQIVFEKVPIGTYGVVSFQDIDRDKKLKTNWVGFPIEPIGFSRDAKIKFGPPDFNDAKITIEANKTLNLTITLK
ncbi:MAG: DUF2141 domain-containing protein [Spirosomataceae bacterium]